MQRRVLTIVGVGLIGGSLGLAARRRGLFQRVRGLGRRLESLAEAQSLGAIDEAHVDPAAALRGADCVVLCTPVDQIAEQALRYAPLCGPGAVLTDAGSTKRQIVDAIEGRLPAGVRFVGSHPLAGSEKKGPVHADADLFRNRWVVLTPTARTDADAADAVESLWTDVGARVRRMTPEDHDRALAVTSHLPHLVASALAGVLPESLRELTATGFRDTTRVAAGDVALWTAIFEHNRSALVDAVERFQSRVEEFRQALLQHDSDAARRLLAEGKATRDALSKVT